LSAILWVFLILLESPLAPDWEFLEEKFLLKVCN